MRQPSARALAFKPTEKQLQAQIVEGLGAAGYIVRQLGHITKQVRCEQCGHWQTPHVGYGNDAGVPDLLVAHRTWPVGIWSGQEVKTPRYDTLLGTIEGGRLSREQRELEELGRIVIIRSLEDALAALRRVK